MRQNMKIKKKRLSKNMKNKLECSLKDLWTFLRIDSNIIMKRNSKKNRVNHKTKL